MILPAHMRDHIIETHNRGTKLIYQAGFEPEPVDVAIAVEEHRWFWKPETVKLVLVAESHVYTSQKDHQIQLSTSLISDLISDTPFAPGNNQSSPIENYVRLVYCLGYGETSLLNENSLPNTDSSEKPWRSSNRGTWQYWKMVFEKLTGTSELQNGSNRITGKVNTLVEMYRRGIWLLDASVHAIYRRHGNAVTGNEKDELHVQWWDSYGKYIMQPGNQAHVWVIGKGVYKALTRSCREFSKMVSGCISQPNAPIKKEKRAFEIQPLLELAESLSNDNSDGRADIVI